MRVWAIAALMRGLVSPPIIGRADVI